MNHYTSIMLSLPSLPIPSAGIKPILTVEGVAAVAKVRRRIEEAIWVFM